MCQQPENITTPHIILLFTQLLTLHTLVTSDTRLQVSGLKDYIYMHTYIHRLQELQVRGGRLVLMTPRAGTKVM